MYCLKKLYKFILNRLEDKFISHSQKLINMMFMMVDTDNKNF